VAAVALAEHVERAGQVLRVSLEESLQEPVHVLSDVLLAVRVVLLVAVREAHASRLVDPHDVGVLVPAVLVPDGVSALGVHGARTVLAEQGELGAAARAASQPNNCVWGEASKRQRKKTQQCLASRQHTLPGGSKAAIRTERVLRGLAARLEEPEEVVRVAGSLDIEVACGGADKRRGQATRASDRVSRDLADLRRART
jgi:hypothetical protein